MSKLPASGPSTAWLWNLVALTVLVQLCTNLIRPATSYKLLSLGYDANAVGMVAAAYAAIPLLIALPLGRVADSTVRISQYLMVSVLGLGLGAALLAFGNNVWGMAAGTALAGISYLVFTVMGQTLIGRRAADAQKDFAFGWFTAGFSFAQTLGPLLTGLVIGHASVASGARHLHERSDVVLWLGVGVLLLCVPFFMARQFKVPASVRNADESKDQERTETKSGWFTMLRLPGMNSQLFAAMVLLSMVDILSAFLPVLGEERGVSAFWVGILLAVRGAASLLSRICLAQVLRVVSRDWLLILALVVSAVTGFTLTLLLQDKLLMLSISVALMLFLGLFLGFGQPITMTLISQLARPERQGSALALRLVGNRIGQVVIPVFSGAVSATGGAAGGIWVTCALLGLSGADRIGRAVRSKP